MRKVTLLSFGAVVLTALILSACGPGDGAGQPEPEPLPPESTEVLPDLELPDLEPYAQEAIVAFADGSSTISGTGGTREAMIGDTVLPGERVTVPQGSILEIQFGEQAVYRITGVTEMAIQSVINTPRQATNRMELAAGRVQALVQDVLPGMRYDIQTRNAVFGVRGTRFVVEALDDGSSILAVQDSEVSYLPLLIDPLRILEQAGGDPPPRLELALAELARMSPVLRAGQSVVLPPSESQGLDDLAQQLIERVEAILENPDTATAELYAALDGAIAEVLDAFLEEAPAPQDIPANLREAAAQTEDLDIRPLEDLGAEAPAPSPVVAEPEATEVVFSITASPANANILADGESGTGSLELRREGAQQISVLVTAPGFTPQRVSLSGEPGQVIQEQVTLQPDIVRTFSMSSARLLGGLTAIPGGIVGLDEFGAVWANRLNGSALWNAQTDNSGQRSGYPVFAGNFLYASGPVEFAVINAAGGNIVARQSFSGPDAHQQGQRVLASGGQIIYLSTEAARFFAAGGELLGEAPFGEGIRTLASPAAVAGGFVTASADGTVRQFAIDGSGMSQAQAVTIPGFGQVVGMRPAVDRSTVYVGSIAGGMAAVSLVNGSVLWNVTLPGTGNAISTDMELGSVGIYAFAQTRVHARRRSNGAQLFAPISGVAAPPLLVGGILYVPMADERMLIVNAASGAVIHSVNLGGVPSTRPALTQDGIAVGTEFGDVIIVREVAQSLLQ